MKILDGGTATEITRLGFKVDSDPLWSARFLHTHPDVLKQVHKNFISAGAEVVITASYQASVEGFQKHLGVSENEAKDLIRSSVCLAQEAKAELSSQYPDVLIAGSVGPYGATLCDGSEYNGHYVKDMTEEEISAWHTPRIEALIESGVDLLAIETIPALKEAQSILNVVDRHPQAKAWVTFSCKDGKHTCYGDSFQEAVSSVSTHPQVVAVGVNCTHPQFISSLLTQLSGYSCKDIIVKANSGEPWEQGKGWYGHDDISPIKDYVTDWLSLGATWIGGCCRIYPSDIVSVKTIVKDYCKSELTRT